MATLTKYRWINKSGISKETMEKLSQKIGVPEGTPIEILFDEARRRGFIK